MKIRLRRTTEADLDFVLGAEQAAENRQFVGAWTRRQHRATAIDSACAAHFIIETVADGEPVGYAILSGLENTDESIELKRLVITAKNKGYGRAALRAIKKTAFEQINAHRLWLDVKEHNKRARHLYETEGFVREGVLRECLKTENGYESLVVMSMLRGEYESQSDGERPILRIAEPDDAEAIAAVLRESFAEYESSYTPQAFAATVSGVEEIKRRFGKETIWVALIGDKIIGTVGVVPRQDSLYARSMAILPEARGKQIGERLLKEIENYAVARNYRRLFLNTTPFLHRAIRLYEKFGFLICGADDLFGTPLVTMEKSLAAADFKTASEK